MKDQRKYQYKSPRLQHSTNLPSRNPSLTTKNDTGTIRIILHSVIVSRGKLVLNLPLRKNCHDVLEQKSCSLFYLERCKGLINHTKESHGTEKLAELTIREP